MSRDSYMQAAFDAVCKEAKTAVPFFVVLMESIPFYGGPEEGGWWGSDDIVVAYQSFASEELAEEAAQAVRKLARELSEQSRRDFGEACAREMEWLEARGLDSDFLPEPDGESSYYVVVTDELPSDRRGSRHYD